MPDPRHQRWRRDLADLLLYRNGQPEHSKFWANVVMPHDSNQGSDDPEKGNNDINPSDLRNLASNGEIVRH